MGKSLYFSEPHCPHLKNEDKNTTNVVGLVQGCGSLHEKQWQAR